MNDISFSIVGYGRMGKLVEKVLRNRSEFLNAIIDPQTSGIWTTGRLKSTDTAICFTIQKQDMKQLGES